MEIKEGVAKVDNTFLRTPYLITIYSFIQSNSEVKNKLKHAYQEPSMLSSTSTVHLNRQV